MIPPSFKAWYKRIEPTHVFGEDVAFDEVIFDTNESDWLEQRKVA